jgi:RNA polymerase sigma factor (sigma-70 family)
MNARSNDALGAGAQQPSDSEQVAEYRAFYQEATRELLDCVLRMGLRPQKAEEIVEIVWLKFIEKGPIFTGAPTAPQCHAWLLRVARNEVVNIFRASSQQPAQWPGEQGAEPFPLGKDDPAAHERLLRRSALFRSWLEELRREHPLRYQFVRARHIEGVSLTELAEKYGLTSHRISVQINRALNHFRAWLVKHPENDESDRD